ncbi:MAG: OmpH family outer membrane protein [Planctomycetota bacterium]
MNHKLLTLAGVLLAVVTVGAYLLGTGARDAAAQNKDKPLKIGVVDVAEVFDKFNERINREKELRMRTERLKYEIDNLRKQAEKIASEMEKLEEDSEEYRKKQEQLIKITSEAQIKAEKGKSDILKRELSERQELYATIRNAVGKYAKENGYDLILKTDDMRVTGKSAVSQDIQMSMRIVLHSTETMDLTRTSIEILNK